MIKLIVSAIAAILLASPVVLGTPNLDVVHVHLVFPSPEFVQLEGGLYPYLRDSVPWSGGRGLPSLPLLSYSVLLPPGSKILDISLETEDVVIARGLELAHLPDPVPCGSRTTPSPQAEPAGAYPSSPLLLDGVRLLRGFSILPISVIPFTYIPGDGSLVFHQSMDIWIYVKPGEPGPMYRGLPQDFERVSEIVVNPEVLSHYPGPESRTQYDYVIITSSDMEEEFQELANYRESLGYDTNIVTVEWIQENFDGQDLQEKIRNFIIYAYQNWGIEYVLLGGDDGVIPHRGFYVYVGQYTDDDIAADLYYAALDGTWNDDGDEYWGEVDEMDPYAEVFVGRAPVEDPQEAQVFVNKTIWYETLRGGADYLNLSLMVGQQLDDYPTWGGDYKDEVAQYVPDDWTVDRLYDRDWPGHDWPKQELIERLEEGRHLVNNMGHGNVGIVAKLYRSDVMSLENDQLFIFYTQACYAGSFDNRYPGGSYDPDDCIGEKMVQNPHGGAVAFIGNSRYGWYSPGSTSGPSQAFDIRFFQVLFDEGERILGRAHQLAKEHLAGSISSNSYLRWCYYELNLLGDPLLWFGGMPSPINIMNPKEGEHVGGEVTVSGLASLPDGTLPDAIYVRLDQGTWSYVSPESPWSTQVDTTPYDDGNHTIWAKAVYGANVYYDNVTVIIDNSPPNIELFEVEGGRYHNTSGITVHLRASDSLSEVTGMRFLLDGAPITDWLEYAEEFTLSVTHEEGNYEFGVEVVDEVGNVASSDPVTITFDFTAPWVRITHPPDGGGVNTDSVEVTWEMEDNLSPIVDVWLSVDGGSWVEVGVQSSYTVNIGPDGNHTVEVRVQDAAGNVGSAISRFLKDSHPPRLSIVFPDEGSWIGPGRLRLSWESEDTDIVGYEVSIDGGDWIPVGMSTTYSLRNLAEGQHSASVRARDIGGNYGYAFVNFTIDKSPPTLTVVQPEEGAIYNSTPIVVMWSGEDEYSGIDHYEVSVDGSEPEDVGTNTSIVLSLGEGNHTVRVAAFDRAGLSTSSVRHFSIDLNPPMFVEVHPSEGEIFSTHDVVLEVRCTDNVSEVSIYFSVDGGEWMPYGGPTPLSLGDGRHEILVSATDQAGHRAQASTWFIIDTVPPEVRIDSPSDGTISNSSEIEVYWNASDSETWVVETTLYLDGEPVACSSPCILELGDGEHSISVEAVDAAGNRAEVSITVLVDTTPPRIEVLGVDEGSFLASSEVSLRVVVEESGEYETEYRVDGGMWEPLIDGQIDLSLAEGHHRIEVRAVDWAGNVGISGVEFTVDLTPPVAEILSPANGKFYSSNVISLEVRVSDNFGVTSVRYSLDGGRWRDYDGEAVLGGLPDGVHWVELRIVDLAGHEATAVTTFHVDTTPPVVRIVRPNPGAVVPGEFSVSVSVLEENLANVTLLLDGESVSTRPTWIPEQNATFRVVAGDGVHTVAVIAEDRAGNSDMDSVTVTVDSTPPYVHVIAPSDGAVLSTKFVTLEFEAGDEGSGLSYVSVSVDGSSPEKVGGSGRVNLGPLSDGQHDVILLAVDKVGNSATSSIRFYVDTRPPSIEVEIHPDRARVGQAVLVSITVDEESEVFVSVDGGPWNPVTGNEYTVQTVGLEPGTHTVAVKAVDRAGNQAVRQASFEVAPRIPYDYLMVVIVVMIMIVAVAVVALRRR